jgi:hypothetical protein
MILRLIVVLILIAGFAVLFSEMVERSGGINSPAPCDEWSNPDCQKPAPPAPQ